MIKTDITAYVNSYEYSGELITPSQVLTSTKQDEELNLAYSPNFTLKLNDAYSYINDMVEVTFSYEDTDYTAYANVINRSAGVVTLQYNSGLTAYVNPPAPVVHTLEISPVGPFSCLYDTYSAAYTNSYEFSMLYDNEALKLGDVTVSGNTYCTIADGETSGSYVFTTTYNEVGEYSDTVTITYNELNAYCTVNATITDSTPVVHTLEFSPVGPFSCSYDNYTEEKHPSDSVWLLYDNSYVDSPRQYITNNAGPNAYTFTIPTSNRINFAVDFSKNPEAGEYNEIYTASYEGLTAYCNVTAVVTDSTPVDPFLEPIEISAPPTDQGDGAYYVESEQAPEVNIYGLGLTYDDMNNNYVFAASSVGTGADINFEQPNNYTINTITFVGMESTYRSFITNDVGPGPIVGVDNLLWDDENPFCSFSNEDGNLVFTMLSTYDPDGGDRIHFSFVSPITTMGTDLTFEKIMIEFTPYNPAT